MKHIRFATSNTHVDNKPIAEVINNHVCEEWAHGFDLVDIKPLTASAVFLIFEPSDHRIP